MFNPFEILNLELSYSINLATLEDHYFEEQRKCHPDQFTLGDAQQKTDALKQSTAVNQAYLILKNPLLRAEYLLKSAGVDTFSNDPIFLGQVMEWNERREQGEDLTSDLLGEGEVLFNNLENAFAAQDYEKAQAAFYQLTYVQKLLKQGEK